MICVTLSMVGSGPGQRGCAHGIATLNPMEISELRIQYVAKCWPHDRGSTQNDQTDYH